MISTDESVVDTLVALQNAADEDTLEDNESINIIKRNSENSANLQKLGVMICAPSVGLTMASKNVQSRDKYDLYVTNEVFDQIISNASNDDTNKDVYLSCQEVETKDGKLFMMASDAIDGEMCSKNSNGKSHCKDFSAPLDPSLKNDKKKEHSINYSKETILSSDVLEKEAGDLLCSEQLSLKQNHCMLCDSTFESIESYHEHYTKFHLNSDKPTTDLHCCDCRESFKKVSTYIEHKMNEHSESDNICCICGELLSTTRSLSNHLKGHFNKQSYTCNTCGRSFRNQQSRQDHIRNKHLKPKHTVFECKFCGSTFQHRRSLKRHIDCVHAKKKVICPQCKKSYSSISSLYYHQRTIHGKVAFHCGYCTAVFKSVSSVKKHENFMHHSMARYRETPTGKIYNYNQLVTNNIDIFEKKTTNCITCIFCKTKHQSHEKYVTHFNKFHKEESLDFNTTEENIDLQNADELASACSTEPWA